MTAGEWSTGTAWSTIKVPLAIAGLRETDPPEVTEAMRAAITQSDNDAAESIWASLGDPATAATKSRAVLAEAGAPDRRRIAKGQARIHRIRPDDMVPQ